MPERWEYRVIETGFSGEWRKKKRKEAIGNLREEIDELGADGWEMVGYESSVVPSSLESFGLCFFKRRAS